MAKAKIENTFKCYISNCQNEVMNSEEWVKRQKVACRALKNNRPIQIGAIFENKTPSKPQLLPMTTLTGKKIEINWIDKLWLIV